ncbi:hypothetical protein WICPIJ_006817 [Wickerhamomyces pijperi]|uniref:non-specific serine/threonine protein kinase n=1 Tax=Wickerhamomyces pijperi TaxID=599730 RepID=A0A9P8Q1B1_WICPI|nr:hypothetical protein WICPIJ_006817 [Wickerhamomyces pijperi]
MSDSQYSGNDYRISSNFQQQDILPKVRSSTSQSSSRSRLQNTAPATPRMLRNTSGASMLQQQANYASPNDQTQIPFPPPGSSTMGGYSTPTPTSREHQQSDPLTSPLQKRTNSQARAQVPPIETQFQTEDYPTRTAVQPNQTSDQAPSQQNTLPAPPPQSRLLPPAAMSQPPIMGPDGTPLNNAPVSSKRTSRQPASQPQSQPQQFHRRAIGDWDFVKTIGAGSMGKVKLARHNKTSEICAVKIVPRSAKVYKRAHMNDPPAATATEQQQRDKEYEKEVARDKRTIRETALGKVLYHPFICRLFEVITMSNHYYMLFEYVSGGQMLDYIVSHGSLKERHARKFARGIGSALDYLHKNNIVHRDLKIENIMISKTGDIKIIDFGLSNMYSSDHLLKTYCGSLYFAAPELLSAHPYVGPEVDVWSFGVVLFVLVCGKVPFDDQSVPVLHEKIKKGKIEYPEFLSLEVLALLKRMLVVSPTKRAPLSEILSHPWMVKGYEGAPGSFLPQRIPLTLPLQQSIIAEMVKLDFGDSEEQLNLDISKVVSSAAYAEASEKWYSLRNNDPTQTSEVDPTSHFHPLVSMYHLVSEMLSRKKAKQSIVDIPSSIQETSNITSPDSTNNKEPAYDTPTKKSEPLVGAVPKIQIEKSESKPLPAIAANVTPTQQHVIAFPEQAHTSFTSPVTPTTPSQHHQQISQSHTLSANEEVFPQQQVSKNKDDGKSLNSIFRRLSHRRASSLRRDPSDHSSPKQHVKIEEPSSFPNKYEGFGSNSKDSSSSVRRTGSVRVPPKSSPFDDFEKTSGLESMAQKPSTLQVPPSQASNSKSHTRTVSDYSAVSFSAGPRPSDKNVDSSVAKSSSVQKKFHPSARAKSVGHAHFNNHKYDKQEASQAMDNDETYFDDVTLEDYASATPKFNSQQQQQQQQQQPSNILAVQQLSESEIMEQANNAPSGSMPSIEFPRTLFLKGFFSVQTTSTKPLPIIRFNIISVLTKLGVQFQEVRGGFVCSHSPSIEPSVPAQLSKKASGTDSSTSAGESNSVTSTGSNTLNKMGSFENSSIGDASTVDQQSTPSSKTGSHRRKFSIGGSILGYRRKQSGSAPPIPPTPVATNYNQHQSVTSPTHGHFPNDFDSSASLDSLNEGHGGSDMLVSSRIEQSRARASSVVNSSGMGDDRAQYQQSPVAHKESLSLAKTRTPLQFEIHVVKVPLVGLFGVQFKKILGNTWMYKALAEQILNELNL